MQVVVDLTISAEEYLRWYSGSASCVLAKTRDGRKIRFPANILQKYVTREGIRGSYLISFNEEHRFEKIDRLTGANSVF